MGKMTVQQIEALKAGDWETVDTGLQIRVDKRGVKTWIIQYVINRKQREYRLPRPYGRNTDDGHFSLKDARNEAERIRALARQGIDIKVQQELMRQAEAKRIADEQAAEQVRREKEQAENLSVNELFNAWVTDGVRRKDGNAELRRSFAKDVLPLIGHIAVKQVTEHDLRTVLRKIVDREANRLAVVICASLTQMFLWAEKRQPWRKLLAEGNPVELIEIEKIVSAEYDINNQRDRILSDEEIIELHTIFATMRSDYEQAQNKRIAVRPVERTTELAIWIMLSTMCRVGETSMARWEHINFDKAEWFIPARNTKGQKGKQNALTVYLSPFALKQFRELHKLTGESEWCFPASNNDGHVSVKSISKQIGDRQTMFKKDKDGNPRLRMKNRSKGENVLVLSGGKKGDWTAHDLRRTGATIMQSLGVPMDIIDRCQNHVLPGSKTRRHYLHHDYATEKRAAWMQLGNRISLLTSQCNDSNLPEKVAA